MPTQRISAVLVFWFTKAPLFPVDSSSFAAIHSICVKLPDSRRQLPWRVSIHLVPRPWYLPDFCAREQPCQLPGGLAVGGVLFPCQDQHRTDHLAQLPAEIQLHHGGGEADGVSLPHPGPGKGSFWHQAEKEILQPQQHPGHFILGGDEHQPRYLLRAADGIVQGQHRPQGKAAKDGWFWEGFHPALQGGVEIWVIQSPFAQAKEVRAGGVRIRAQGVNHLVPAVRPLAQAVEKKQVHGWPPFLTKYPPSPNTGCQTRRCTPSGR